MIDQIISHYRILEKLGVRRHGRCLQGRGRNPAPLCRPEVSAGRSSERPASLGPIPAGGSGRGVVVNEPIGALAHLGLARAYGLQGNTAKAQVSYGDFLILWKDADPDVPILKQAKTEYAKLQ
jgi:hypothetical protein